MFLLRFHVLINTFLGRNQTVQKGFFSMGVVFWWPIGSFVVTDDALPPSVIIKSIIFLQVTQEPVIAFRACIACI